MHSVLNQHVFFEAAMSGLRAAEDYPRVHDIIFETLHKQKDPSDTKFKCLYDALSQKGITYEKLKGLLQSPSVDQQPQVKR